MPWTPQDAKNKRKGLSDKEANLWSATANGVLSSCLESGGEQDECEAKAIRTAHAAVNRSRRKNGKSASDKYGLFSLESVDSLSVYEDSFDDDKKEFDIQIIKPGRSLNGTIYSAQNMKEIKALLDLTSVGMRGRKMYVNHVKLKPREAYSGRDIRDWGATVKRAWLPKEDGTEGVRARVRITKRCEWLYDMAQNHGEELGVSIFASILAERVDDAGDGQPGILVHQVVRMISPDWVTEPAAGGGVVSEDVDVEDFDSIIEEAKRIANGDAKLLTVIESITKGDFDVTEDDESALIDSDGKIKPFSVALQDAKNEEQARELWWNLYAYMGELLFRVEGVDITAKVDAAKNAVEVAFTKINELLGSDGSNSESLKVILDGSYASERLALQAQSLMDAASGMTRSGISESAKTEDGLEIKTVEDLRSAHPDLVKTILEEAVKPVADKLKEVEDKLAIAEPLAKEAIDLKAEKAHADAAEGVRKSLKKLADEKKVNAGVITEDRLERAVKRVLALPESERGAEESACVEDWVVMSASPVIVKNLGGRSDVTPERAKEGQTEKPEGYVAPTAEALANS